MSPKWANFLQEIPRNGSHFFTKKPLAMGLFLKFSGDCIANPKFDNFCVWLCAKIPRDGYPFFGTFPRNWYMVAAIFDMSMVRGVGIAHFNMARWGVAGAAKRRKRDR